jgi:hypothetical protein
MSTSACVRRITNFSVLSKEMRFDNPEFDPEKLRSELHIISPKMVALLNKIDELDQADRRRDGKLYKHFIFTDIREGNYGVRAIASALIAHGFTPAIINKGTTEDPTLHLDVATKKANKFGFLSSTSIYNKPISVQLKKKMLAVFNARPDNVHGDYVRFIILDAGFKEGVDLFDIKYVHLFEPPMTEADRKQSIGRATRICGQKGLPFRPNSGWKLEVYMYNVSIPRQAQLIMGDYSNIHEVIMDKAGSDARMVRFTNDVINHTIKNAVDRELNTRVNNFSAEDSSDELSATDRTLFHLYRKSKGKDDESAEDIVDLPIGEEEGQTGGIYYIDPVLLKSFEKNHCQAITRAFDNEYSHCGQRANKYVPFRVEDMAEIWSARGNTRDDMTDAEKQQTRKYYCRKLTEDPGYCKEVIKYVMTKYRDLIRYADSYFIGNRRMQILADMEKKIRGIAAKKYRKAGAEVDARVAENPSASSYRNAAKAHAGTPQGSLENSMANLLNAEYEYDYLVRNPTDTSVPLLSIAARIAGWKAESGSPAATEERTLAGLYDQMGLYASSLGASAEKSDDYQRVMRVMDQYSSSVMRELGRKYRKIAAAELLESRSKMARLQAVYFEDRSISVEDLAAERRKMSDEYGELLSKAEVIAGRLYRKYTKDQLNTSSINAVASILASMREAAALIEKHKYERRAKAYEGYKDNKSKIWAAKYGRLARLYEKVAADEIQLADHLRNMYDTSSVVLDESIEDVGELIRVRRAIDSLLLKERTVTSALVERGLGDAVGLLDDIVAEAVADEKRIIYNMSLLRSRMSNEGFGYKNMRGFVVRYYADYEWQRPVVRDGCKMDVTSIKFTPTQGFMRNWFNMYNPLKGCLLWHSVGTGKTCAAIAAATTTFARHADWRMIWVTRATLKPEIWKNVFDRSCSICVRSIKKQNPGLEWPESVPDKKRVMRGYCKNEKRFWRWDPISYLNFSNSVKLNARGFPAPENPFGRKLFNRALRLWRKENGIKKDCGDSCVRIPMKEVDPLRKTVIVIDEAHKLYGGDLKWAERPDVDMIAAALKRSYAISGAKSCKLLLMTATPITGDGMELVKLINLLIEKKEDEFPTDFDKFARRYLDEAGYFKKESLEEFYNKTAGLVSFLDREADPSQFAQPRYHPVINAPISGVREEVGLEDRCRKDIGVRIKAGHDQWVAECNGSRAGKCEGPWENHKKYLEKIGECKKELAEEKVGYKRTRRAQLRQLITKCRYKMTVKKRSPSK